MIRLVNFSSLRFTALFVFLIAAGQLRSATDVKPLGELPEVFKKKLPETINDLRAIQDRVEKVVDRVMPAVVSVRVGASFGSAVIVSKDGYMLTAGHVSGVADRDVTVYFHNGKKAKAKTLGGNHGIDTGMMKITTEGEWPFCEMGNSAEVKAGQWCLVCAHPGGFKPGRTPPVRLGRVINVSSNTLVTECTLVGGDSGGPLFDMNGKVIGINSRIGQNITANMHVPVNPFKDNWDKLAKGEVWKGNGPLGGGGFQPTENQPYIGIAYSRAGRCVVEQVEPNSPAAKAGLKVDDVILKMNSKEVDSGPALASFVRQTTPGARVKLAVQRGEETLTITVVIGKRPKVE